MKKIALTINIILFSFACSACDICGCGLGNYYIGLLPQFNHSFLGLRYKYSSFHTNIKNEPTEFSKDFFQTIEVWGGMNIGKRWQILTMLPFNNIHQTSDDGTLNAKGLGDIAVMGNYKVFEHSSVTAGKKLVSQQVWLGAGIKLATGKFSIDSNDPDFVAQANTQVGSGSNDFMLNALYNISIDKFGVTTGANYKINTTNNDQYFFGNKFSATSMAYYVFSKTKTIITPNAGLMFDHTEANLLQNQKVDETGGYLLSTAAGVEVSFNKITLGCNVQLPLSQNFASAQTTTQIKGMFHVTFSL